MSRKFKEFKVGDLFNIRPTKSYKMTNKDLYKSSGNIPVLSNSEFNNGIGGYCGLEPTEEGNIVTFSDTTTGADTMFYQPTAFIGYSHVQGMYPIGTHIWSEYHYLYVISAIRKSAGTGWSYANKFNRNLVKNIKVLLPVKSKYIPNLINISANQGGGYDYMNNIDVSSWREFRLDELFEKVIVKKINGKASDFPEYPIEDNIIPLLTAGIENQGLSRYAKIEDCPTILKNVISISANGANTGVTYYQETDFAILQDAYAIKLKDMDIPNKEIGLFLASIINKVLHRNFDWSNKATWNKIKDLTIKLPFIEVEEIDWDFMEKYIRAIEKVVITDVVKYKDVVIETTKKVVSRK